MFQRLRERLEQTLSVRPEQATTDLYRHLFVGGAPAAGLGPHNLPTFSTSFVGRQRELRELGSALERTRLLTLTGPGGSGKTRLAVELAHRQFASRQHPDGVWLVELAGLSRGELVAPAIAATLCLSLGGDRPAADALGDQVAGRQVLLVFDNCEHVLDFVADLTEKLLARCAELTIVTTSREPLGLPGELTWRVPPLELPSSELDHTPEALARLESVQLFVERARHAVPSFTLDDANAPGVAEICRRLDGIPLALELAAARVAHLSVGELSERLGDALHLLRRTGPHRPDRQQTLASTLTWSHDLLSGPERTVFRRLSVFAGGFDLDAATEVCATDEALAVLSRLVDKSLVIARRGNDPARYRLLEVVRQYAEARLNEAGERSLCRRRHCRWYGRQATLHDPDGGNPVVREPPLWFDTEQDNLRAALSSAIDDEPLLALQLATSTWRFFMSRGQIAEGLGWLTAALEHCPEPSLLRARALFALGVLHLRRAEIEPLREIGRRIVESCAAVGDDNAVALALDQHAILTLMAQDWRAAIKLSSAAIAREGVDPRIVTAARHFNGVLALAVGDKKTARESLAAAAIALEAVPPDALPFFTALTVSWVLESRGPLPLLVAEETMLLGRRVGAGQARGYLAVAAAVADRTAGEEDQALRRLDLAVSCFRQLEDAYGLAYAISQRGHTLRAKRSLDAAVEQFQQAEALRRSLRDERAVAMAITGRSLVEALRGQPDPARDLAEEALGMMRRSGDIPGIALTANDAALVELILGNPVAAAAALETSVQIGDRLGPVHVAGWQHLLLAHLRRLLGDHRGSAVAAQEALTRFEAFADRRGVEAVQSACKAGLVTMAV